MNRVISEKIKTNIIEQVVFGDDVRDVAEKHHVSRASIYMQGIFHTLKISIHANK